MSHSLVKPGDCETELPTILLSYFVARGKVMIFSQSVYM